MKQQPARVGSVRTRPANATFESEAGFAGTVFVYTGMGIQWWGMGEELFAAEPIFRDAIAGCDETFKPLAGWSLADIFESEQTRRSLGGREYGSPSTHPRFAQPANMALQVALTAIWRDYGVVPDAVIGHSHGEIAAAWAAGSMSLADALRLTYALSELQAQGYGHGKMLAAGIGREEAERLVCDRNLTLAAINGPSSVTLSGGPATVRELANELDERSIFNVVLEVGFAYHSDQLDPMRDELFESMRSLSPREPHTTLYSSVTGEKITDTVQDADYWWRSARSVVVFHDAVKRMREDGYSTFVEIGPHPALAGDIFATFLEDGRRPNLVSTLARGEPECQQVTTSVAYLSAVNSA